MRSYNGPRQNCKSKKKVKQKTDKEMHNHQETAKDVPQPILGELGPPPGPDIDLSGMWCAVDCLCTLFAVLNVPSCQYNFF